MSKQTFYEAKFGVKPLDDFDWSPFEDGWNGKSLQVNNTIKCGKNERVYCHEAYAQSLAKSFNVANSQFDEGCKDLEEGSVIRITDARLVGDDELLLSTSTGGAAVVNLTKENKFFELLETTKETFKSVFKNNPTEASQNFVQSYNLAKIEKNGKASLYKGTLIKIEEDFKEQIALGDKSDKAYTGKIVGSNRGGFIIEINGIKCFLPGGQASSNKLLDFESLVGTEMEVMMLKYIDGSGFLVSRKKYLDKVKHQKIDELRALWEKDKESMYIGNVTGAKHYGIFIELNEFYTGMLHRTYATEETLEKLTSFSDDADDSRIDENAMKNFTPGQQIAVKIYNITESGKIVFTDIMDKATRDAIVAEREKVEAEAEAQAKAEAEARKAEVQAEKTKKMKSRADNAFKGTTISLADLKK